MRYVALVLPVVCSLACGGADPPPVTPVATAPAPVAPPVATAASTDAGPAAVRNGGQVVGAMRGDFRACYNDGLKRDPTMQGHVMLSLIIGPAGDVASVVPSSVDGIADDVVDCMLRRVKAAVFPPPGPNGTTLRIPIYLTPQAARPPGGT